MQRIYDKNPEIQEVIDASMIEVYTGEGASPEPVYFFFIAVVFIIMVILGKYLNKSVEEIKAAYGNSRSYIKKGIFNGIMQVFSFKGFI